jgi:hypothetical protein
MVPSPITATRDATPILQVTFDFKKEEDEDYDLSGQDYAARIRSQSKILTVMLNQESLRARRKIGLCNRRVEKLAQKNEALEKKVEELNGEMAELKRELNGEMAELKRELNGEVAELKREVAKLKEAGQVRERVAGPPQKKRVCPQLHTLKGHILIVFQKFLSHVEVSPRQKSRPATSTNSASGKPRRSARLAETQK